MQCGQEPKESLTEPQAQEPVQPEAASSDATPADAAPADAMPATPEERRAARFAQRYPALQEVPPEKRAAMIRKAFVHPLFLLVMVPVALVVLPETIHFLMRVLHLHSEAEPGHQAWKILVSIFTPAILFFWLLRHAVLPLALGRVLRKEGYAVTKPGEQKTHTKL